MTLTNTKHFNKKDRDRKEYFTRPGIKWKFVSTDEVPENWRGRVVTLKEYNNEDEDWLIHEDPYRIDKFNLLNFAEPLSVGYSKIECECGRDAVDPKSPARSHSTWCPKRNA